MFPSRVPVYDEHGLVLDAAGDPVTRPAPWTRIVPFRFTLAGFGFGPIDYYIQGAGFGRAYWLRWQQDMCIWRVRGGYRILQEGTIE